MGSRSEVIVDEHSQVLNSVDRTNKCASDGELMTGKLWQLSRGRAPHHLVLSVLSWRRLERIQLAMLSRHCDTVVENREVASDRLRHQRHNFDGYIYIHYAAPPYSALISSIYFIPFGNAWLGSREKHNAEFTKDG